MKFSSEQALAARVVEWLTDLRWTVYQEVTCKGSVADIVAVQGRRSWVIECKLTFGLGVLDQAAFWRGRCNWSSVAVPPARRGRLGEDVARWLGVGVLRVGYGDDVREEAAARLWKPRENIALLCNEGHRAHAKAGAPGGAGRWTPFRQTCDNVARAVVEQPGITLKELVDEVQHHYATPASARAALPHWIERGLMPGVSLRREGRRMRLYPAQPTRT